RITRENTTTRSSVSARANARCRHAPRGARANTMTPSVIVSDAIADAGKYQIPLVGATTTVLAGGSGGDRSRRDAASRSIAPIATIATNRCLIRMNDTRTIAIAIRSTRIPDLVANQLKNLAIDTVGSVWNLENQARTPDGGSAPNTATIATPRSRR